MLHKNRYKHATYLNGKKCDMIKIKQTEINRMKINGERVPSDLENTVLRKKHV